MRGGSAKAGVTKQKSRQHPLDSSVVSRPLNDETQSNNGQCKQAVLKAQPLTYLADHTCSKSTRSAHRPNRR